MQGTEACSCSVFLRNCTYLPPVRERRQQVCSLLAAELSWDVKNYAKWSCQEIFIFRQEVDIVLAFCQFLRFPSFGRWKVCSFFSMSKDFPSSWTNITLYIQTQLGRKKKKKNPTQEGPKGSVIFLRWHKCKTLVILQALCESHSRKKSVMHFSLPYAAEMIDIFTLFSLLPSTAALK